MLERFPGVREALHLVSGHLRENHVLQGPPVVITADSLEAITRGAPKDVVERFDRLLLNLARSSPHDGYTLELRSERDYPLGYCVNVKEFNYFVAHLRERGLVKEHAQQFLLTINAWERVRELKQTSLASSQAFVAMDFSKEARPIFDKGLAKGVRKAGWHPFRIDRAEHAKRIDDEIIVQIDASRFLVADFTNQKHGVYFEAGYALSAGIPVIWCCRRDQIDQLHFDVNHYNQIDWETHEELADRLSTRILALVGRGPGADEEGP